MNALVTGVNIVFVPAISALLYAGRRGRTMKSAVELFLYYAVFAVINLLIYYVLSKAVQVIFYRTVSIHEIKYTALSAVIAVILPYALEIVQKAFTHVQFETDRRDED